jgi:hypothetical protein
LKATLNAALYLSRDLLPALISGFSLQTFRTNVHTSFPLTLRSKKFCSLYKAEDFESETQVRMKTALFCFITQRAVANSYRRFGTFRSHVQGAKKNLALKMGMIGCPETSVVSCHYSLPDNPEERNSH